MSEADRAAGPKRTRNCWPSSAANMAATRRPMSAAWANGWRAAAGLEGQCTFTLVNSDVVNAFAVPGCYIYVTRGLMGIVNSEAELAAVARARGRPYRRPPCPAAAAAVAVADARRDRGRRADRLGATDPDRRRRGGAVHAALFAQPGISKPTIWASDYLREAGLDPYEAADMLDALGRHERHQARTRGVDQARSIPEWARTHPLSENRTGRAREAAAATGVEDDALPENAGRYLGVVDGLLYGDDPAAGVRRSAAASPIR